MSTEKRHLNFEYNIAEARIFDWRYGFSERLGLKEVNNAGLDPRLQQVLFHSYFQERVWRTEIQGQNALLAHPLVFALDSCRLTSWLLRSSQKNVERKQEQLRLLEENVQDLVNVLSGDQQRPLVAHRARVIELAANNLAAQVLPRVIRSNVVLLQFYKPDEVMINDWSKRWKIELEKPLN